MESLRAKALKARARGEPGGANFFQRSGYQRNPVAIRHNTVARLLAVTDARMDTNSARPGAKELAAAFGH